MPNPAIQAPLVNEDARDEQQLQMQPTAMQDFRLQHDDDAADEDGEDRPDVDRTPIGAADGAEQTLARQPDLFRNASEYAGQREQPADPDNHGQEMKGDYNSVNSQFGLSGATPRASARAATATTAPPTYGAAGPIIP